MSNASKLVEALRAEFPDFVYVTTENKPRSGSFEITLTKQNESKYILKLQQKSIYFLK